jgi:hypothetical protein
VPGGSPGQVESVVRRPSHRPPRCRSASRPQLCWARRTVPPMVPVDAGRGGSRRGGGGWCGAGRGGGGGRGDRALVGVLVAPQAARAAAPPSAPIMPRKARRGIRAARIRSSNRLTCSGSFNQSVGVGSRMGMSSSVVASILTQGPKMPVSATGIRGPIAVPTAYLPLSVSPSRLRFGPHQGVPLFPRDGQLVPPLTARTADDGR